MLARSLALVVLVATAAAQARGPKGPPRPEASPPTRVGTSMPIQVEPRLEHAFVTGRKYLWADLVSVAGASFLKAHLVDVNLRAGDVLTLRSASGRLVEEIRGRGPKERGTFWALSAFGEELELEFEFAEPYARAPFRIDQIILGDASILALGGPTRDVCAPEDFDDVYCYQSDAGKWSNVMASVGVMTIGGSPTGALFCSGANVSPRNYVLTNRHCITSEADCDESEFVFKYYRQGCNVGAPVTADWQGFHCDQVVAASPAGDCEPTLAALDFSLCSVIGDPAASFGYARPDPLRLTDGEAIYIVQHANGRPHEIVHGSGANVDVDGTVLRYHGTLDTEFGSSGAPIFRESDDKLVGLHACSGCTVPGVGNRGMLMADIYPEIAPFLCTPVPSLVPGGPAGFAQVRGDGDTVMEPGETWSFTPCVRNVACDVPALGVAGTVRVNAAALGRVQLLDSAVSFGDVAAGSAKSALAPIRFRVAQAAPCGSAATFDLVDLVASNAGPFANVLASSARTIGEDPLVTLFSDGFSTPPGGWTVVHGGNGTGAASTWTSANPGARSLSLAEPFFIADSDWLGSGHVMDEQLVSPVIDCSHHSIVELQFKHVFLWYSGGLDEQGDVDVRSSATGGTWVNVRKFQDADASGTVMVDVSAQAGGRSDVQVRFHYYDAAFEWWWAVDDVALLGSNGPDCDLFVEGTIGGVTPLPPAGKIR